MDFFNVIKYTQKFLRLFKCENVKLKTNAITYKYFVNSLTDTVKQYSAVINYS